MEGGKDGRMDEHRRYGGIDTWVVGRWMDGWMDGQRERRKKDRTIDTCMDG